MFHTKKLSLGDMIWRGNEHAIVESRERFHEEPEKRLVVHTSTLYSFRRREDCVRELVSLRHHLLARSEALRSTAWDSLNIGEVVDQADVLSTILGWLSDSTKIPSEQQEELRKEACAVCEFGLQILEDLLRGVPTANHSWHLLKLTRAALSLRDGKIKDAFRDIHIVDREKDRVFDPRQRARVYRKLGMLYRAIDDSIGRGFWMGVRAVFVPGVPLAVRLKSLGALVGLVR